MADTSMLELFKIELENYGLVLEQGLVTLENDPAPANIEPLMRAAHSIKGAAKIVGLEPAVTLAHAMEDVLSAAQQLRHQLGRTDIDLLLQGHDLLAQLRKLPPGDLNAGLEQCRPRINSLAEQLRQRCEPAPRGDTDQHGPTPDTQHATRDTRHPTPSDDSNRVVRIQAERLSRIMGLAGECLVQARACPDHVTAMRSLKNGLHDIGSSLEQVLDERAATGSREDLILWMKEVLSHSENVSDQLDRIIEQFDRFSRRLTRTADRLHTEVIASRMRPFAQGTHGFPRMVRDLAQQLDKDVVFKIKGADTAVDRDILEKLEAPLTHLLRNALDHGIESTAERRKTGKPARARIILEARHRNGVLAISVRDDGRGVDVETIRRGVLDHGHATPEMAASMDAAELLEFLYLPGFSTAEKITDLSGRGVGLDVVHAMIRELGGKVRIETEPGRGTAFLMDLPLTLSVARVLPLIIAGEWYAAPLARVERLCTATRVRTIEDRRLVQIDDEWIGLLYAHEILNLPMPSVTRDQEKIMVISEPTRRYGLVIDGLGSPCDLVVIPLDPRLGDIPNISAGAIRDNGEPILVLDIDDLLASIAQRLKTGKPAQAANLSIKETQTESRRILIADDSPTVCEVERGLLEHGGYAVDTAFDGIEAWRALESKTYDLLVTDVDMPRLDGLELVRRLRASPGHRDLPIVMVSYKDRPEDRARGLQAGANAYLTKGAFHDVNLLNMVHELIEKAARAGMKAL